MERNKNDIHRLSARFTAVWKAWTNKRGTGESKRGTGQHERGTAGITRANGQKTRGIGGNNRGTGRHNRGSGQNKRGTEQSERGTGQSKRGTGHQKRGTGQNNRGTGQQHMACITTAVGKAEGVDQRAYANAASKDDQHLMGSPLGALWAAERPTCPHQRQLPIGQLTDQPLRSKTTPGNVTCAHPLHLQAVSITVIIYRRSRKIVGEVPAACACNLVPARIPTTAFNKSSRNTFLSPMTCSSMTCCS